MSFPLSAPFIILLPSPAPIRIVNNLCNKLWKLFIQCSSSKPTSTQSLAFWKENHKALKSPERVEWWPMPSACIAALDSEWEQSSLGLSHFPPCFCLVPFISGIPQSMARMDGDTLRDACLKAENSFINHLKSMLYQHQLSELIAP